MEQTPPPPIYRFDEEKHIHYLKGKRVPGVSTISKLAEDSSRPLMYWAVNMVVQCLGKNTRYEEGQIVFHNPANDTDLLLNEENYKSIFAYAKKEHEREKDNAADRGTRVHSILEKYFLDEPYEVEPDIQKSVDAFLEWVEKFKVRPLFTEQTVYSLKHNYAGIFDLGAVITAQDGERKLLIDFKTSKSVYISHMVQSAGYKIAHEEMYGPTWDGLGILSLHPETGYPLWIDLTGYTEELEQAFLSCLQLNEVMKPISRLRYKFKQELDKALALLEDSKE